VNSILGKRRLPESRDDHRRVLAVLVYLRAEQAELATPSKSRVSQQRSLATAGWHRRTARVNVGQALRKRSLPIETADGRHRDAFTCGSLVD
jgi:hypothetical protein